MKIAVINTYSNGSTGVIAESIANYASHNNHTVKMFYGREKTVANNWTFVGESKLPLLISNALTFITGKVGSFHKKSTKRLINELSKFNPDVIHLHNIHGNYLNFKILFKYLSSFNGKVIITAHDEFLITGRCALCFCNKWKTGCSKCKFLSAYPRVLVDFSKKLQREKIEFLKRIKNLKIVTPSNWLKSYFSESLLSFADCRCIHNGIKKDTPSSFDISSLVEKNKINLIFSAYTWSVEKGSKIIKELYNIIDKRKFNIIVTGVTKSCNRMFDFDCKKIGLLNRSNLLYLISKCDVFINPTFKDNLPTILIESIQVGTPVLTFDTGGCKEIIDSTCGVVVKEKTAQALLKELNDFDYSKEWKSACQRKAKEFEPLVVYSNYLELYEK